MEIIGKISKGTNFDQIYLQKNRYGLSPGDYVSIKPLTQTIQQKPLFYNLTNLEPLKFNIIEEIFQIVEQNLIEYENIIITGSFLNKGFLFNDVDILIISEKKLDLSRLKQAIEIRLGINPQLLLLSNKALQEGLATDPLYQAMVYTCAAKKRLIFKTKRKIEPKLLDLHLLNSKTLPDNFEILSGQQKYYYTRNLIAILLFIQKKKVTPITINQEIMRIFQLEDIKEIQQNMLTKKKFIKKYKQIYSKTFNKIMNLIEYAKK